MCVHACGCVHSLDLLVCCVAVWNSPVFSCEDAHRIEELLEEASRFDSKVHGTSSTIVCNEIKFELAVCRGLSHHTSCVVTCLSNGIITVFTLKICQLNH